MRKKGKQAEDIAKAYLISQKYIFVCANYHTRFAEVDLIFRTTDQIIFVEVKYRQDKTKGIPTQAITAHKRNKITQAALQFMQAHPELPQAGRIDAVSITGDLEGDYQLDHFPNITNA